MNSPLTQLGEDISITRVWRGTSGRFEVVLHESGHFDIIQRDEEETEVWEVVDWHAETLDELDELVQAITLIRDTALFQDVLPREAP